MRPYVGRRPTTPHRVLGETMETSVSVPTETPTRPPDVAAADPADDPLEPCSMFHGFLVMPPNHRSPCASAPIDNFASRTAPALSRRSITVAVYSGIWFWYGSAPHVVFMPFVADRSLAPYGTPRRRLRWL